VRIVAGRLKGRTLEVPEGRDIRPTADRTRQALFDVLEHGRLVEGGGSAVVEAVVLDAFCGSGALGLEALSRGAAEAVFMDASREALDCARTNAKRLGQHASFVLANATNPPRPLRPATLAFLDPPYGSGLAGPALTALAKAGWFVPGAVASVEMPGPELAHFETPPGFERLDERRYGKARILLLRAVGLLAG